MALRQYSAGQSEIARYIKNGESHFNMLIADIEKRNIKIGAKYNDILRRYGEPVLIWNTEAPSLISKKLLYRKPVDYFSTDRVYLYFDNSDALVKLEHCPALKKIKESYDVQTNN